MPHGSTAMALKVSKVLGLKFPDSSPSSRVRRTGRSALMLGVPLTNAAWALAFFLTISEIGPLSTMTTTPKLE
eukprot:1240678-Amphidinium_carterae.2